MCPFRDRPFNLKGGGGGLWFFVSFRNFFSDNTRVKIFIFLSHKAQIFFPEFNIRLYDKNSESIIFFSSPKIRIFFSATLGISSFCVCLLCECYSHSVCECHDGKKKVPIFVNAGHFVNVKGKELLQLNHQYML